MKFTRLPALIMYSPIRTHICDHARIPHNLSLGVARQSVVLTDLQSPIVNKTSLSFSLSLSLFLSLMICGTQEKRAAVLVRDTDTTV
jgi:hypothetical protein